MFLPLDSQLRSWCFVLMSFSFEPLTPEWIASDSVNPLKCCYTWIHQDYAVSPILSEPCCWCYFDCCLKLSYYCLYVPMGLLLLLYCSYSQYWCDCWNHFWCHWGIHCLTLNLFQYRQLMRNNFWCLVLLLLLLLWAFAIWVNCLTILVHLGSQLRDLRHCHRHLREWKNCKH